MMIKDAKPISRETVPRFTSEPIKIPRERFQTIVRWFAEQPNVPPELANALRAVAWLVEVDTFRELEESAMLDGNYEDKLPIHRIYLSELIADGEGIVWNIKKNGMAASELKFALEDVQATLDSLHTAFRCEHGPKNSQKTNELIAKLFDGSEP